MFSKIKKYVIGFFVLCGGILFAFLSGKSAGRRDEKLGGLKKQIKDTNKSIKSKQKQSKVLKKTLENKKKALKEIEKEKYKKKNVGAKEAADFIKKYAKKKSK
jgi:septal ring factor EnvC (AmiA/AmiB activator)